VEVAGRRSAVDRFRGSLERGPRLARIVRVRELPPTEDPLPLPFEIRR
jgi:hypothetical protein